MQEKTFIFDYFLSFLSGDAAKNDFINQPDFDDAEQLKQQFTVCRQTEDFIKQKRNFVFAELPDLRECVERTAKDYLPDVADMFHLKKSLEQWQELSVLLDDPEYPLLQEKISRIEFPENILKMLKNSFEEDGSIADSASPELKRIRGLKKSIRSRIEKTLQIEITRISDDLTEKRIAFREGRYVLPVKTAAKNRTAGIVHAFSATGSTAFIEPQAVIAMNNELLSVDETEHREILRLLKVWSSQIKADSDLLLALLNESSALEIFFAKACFAKKFAAVFAEIPDDRDIILDQIYNPFLLLKKGRKNTVPLDLHIDPQTSGIIISGPNAGGKSAVLKTLALAAWMMKKGLPVPAKKIVLPLFDKILLEIGDSQSLDDELSTFSGHIASLKDILSQAGKHSLVLIDEIAHATDPLEGEALASAVIDRLLETGAFFGITTHYQHVKEKAFEHPDIRVYATAFDLQTLKSEYTLQENTIGKSYALQIAERVGLDRGIVEKAAVFLRENKNEKDQIIANITEFSNKLHNKESELKKREELLRQKEEQFNKEEQLLNKQKIELQTKGLEAADQELNMRLKELSRLKNTMKGDIKNSENILKTTKELITKKKIESLKHFRNQVTHIEKGMEIFVSSLNKNAVVEEIFADEVLLRVGIFKITISKSDLFEADSPLNRTPLKKSFIPADAQHTIDLRGKSGYEAVQILEKSIHKALAAGYNELSVIHGKGTGALQKKIHEFLKSNRDIKEFYFAPPQEGGTGKTIIKF